jgi:hypothetical protein
MYLYTRTSWISEKKGKTLLFGRIRHLVCLGNERRDSSPRGVGHKMRNNINKNGPMPCLTKNPLDRILKVLPDYSLKLACIWNMLNENLAAKGSKRHFHQDIPPVSQKLRKKTISLLRFYDDLIRNLFKTLTPTRGFTFIFSIKQLKYIVKLTYNFIVFKLQYIQNTVDFVSPRNCTYELKTIRMDIHIIAPLSLSSLLPWMFVQIQNEIIKTFKFFLLLA